jgi:hypothetical protein
VEAVAVDRQDFHLLLGEDEAGGVFAGVQLGGDGQPGARGGGADQLDDGLVAGQRPTAPVAGDLREQPCSTWGEMRACLGARQRARVGNPGREFRAGDFKRSG